MKKAVIYTRSASGSKRQLSEQVAVCKKYAAENGYEIVDVYGEIGLADISELLRKIKCGDFGYIIATSADRITRNMQDHRIVKRYLQFMGVQLIEIMGAK